MIPECVVNKLSDFISRVDREKQEEENNGNNNDFIFRGQVRDKPLLPKLARSPLHHDFENREGLMFEEFKRTSLGLTDFIPQSDWDFLALAQHHGLPTRLLDWTYGALSGVYFAVENGPGQDGGKLLDAVVWLLKTRSKDFIKSEELRDISPFEKLQDENIQT